MQLDDLIPNMIYSGLDDVSGRDPHLGDAINCASFAAVRVARPDEEETSRG